MKLSCVIVKL
jgi:hypothetical protein